MVKSYQLADHELTTPVVAAAGLINGPEAQSLLRNVAAAAETEIGAVTVGSWTMLKRLGNAALFGEPTDHFDPQTGEMTNALGLPNVGLDEGQRLVEPIKAEASPKPVIFSASPTTPEAGIGDAVDQSLTLVRRLFAAGAELVELNVSCPNVVDPDGSRKPIMGHDPQTMDRLAQELADDADSNLYADRLGLKLPPYIGLEDDQTQRQVAKILGQAPVGFVVASNTIPGHRPVDDRGRPILSVPDGLGGLSGPKTYLQGRQQLALWRHSLPQKPIVSALGAYDGQEVATRLNMGAVAVGMNARFWHRRSWQQTVTEILVELSQHLDD